MATAAKKNFSPEDFSRFLIREFLKKSGFDRTYDIFMTEDQRPKVTMTKSELTNLLGLDHLVRQNSKTKAHNTMLDVISHFLTVMKAQQGGVTLATGGSSSEAKQGGGAQQRGLTPTSETTQASTNSSIPANPRQNQQQVRGSSRPSGVGANQQYGTQQPGRAVPQTADPYGSAIPAPICSGAPARTQANFFNQSGGDSAAQYSNLKNSSSNALFGGDSTSQPVQQKKSSQQAYAGGAGSKHATKVVADDDDDDWDRDDSPRGGAGGAQTSNVNQREQNGMAFFNRAPLNASQSSQVPPQGATTVNQRQVPAQHRRDQGFMRNVPNRDDDLDDFDDDWSAPSKQNPAAATGKGPNPMLRQQVNAARPMTSGKPGQRGYHGIGQYKPAGGGLVSGNNDPDELDDMLDAVGGAGPDPLTLINQKKAQKQRQQQKPAQAAVEDDDDPLGFLKKAAEESKRNEERRNRAAQEAVAAYKTLDQLAYNLDGYSPQERDSYQMGGGMPSGQISNLLPEETNGIKQLLFSSERGSFHDSWAQGFFFDPKMNYAIFQEKGGPCGILATVQAFFLKHLLFVQKQKLTSINPAQRNSFIASAITDILLNAASGRGSSGAVIIVLPQGSGRSFGGGGRSNTAIQPGQCQKQTIPRGADQRKRVLSALLGNIGSFTEARGPGVACLVYSVILTKGVQQTQDDFDMEGCALINEHGYASQELINIMLVGRACSNVHDGDKDLGDGMVLKGIPRKSEIGFLTFFEHFGYFEVGEHLKRPTLPIWIVCSESHYSIMFSTNFSLAQQQVSAQGRSFDLIYYDELARQADDIILTVEPGKYVAGGRRGADGRVHKEHTIPIDSVIRTKWKEANISWNGRTVIL